MIRTQRKAIQYANENQCHSLPGNHDASTTLAIISVSLVGWHLYLATAMTEVHQGEDQESSLTQSNHAPSPGVALSPSLPSRGRLSYVSPRDIYAPLY